MYLDVVVDFASPVSTASSPSSTMSSVEPADVVADGTCSGGLQHVKCDRHSVNMRQYHRPPSSRINAHTTKSSRQYRVNVHAYCMYVCIHESSYRLCFPMCIYWRKNARSTETPCGYIQRHTYITKSSDDTCILAELLEQSSLRGLESVVASVIALARAQQRNDWSECHLLHRQCSHSSFTFGHCVSHHTMLIYVANTSYSYATSEIRRMQRDKSDCQSLANRRVRSICACFVASTCPPRVQERALQPARARGRPHDAHFSTPSSSFVTFGSQRGRSLA